jgi:hypothetical protein
LESQKKGVFPSIALTTLSLQKMVLSGSCCSRKKQRPEQLLAHKLKPSAKPKKHSKTQQKEVVHSTQPTTTSIKLPQIQTQLLPFQSFLGL